MATSLADTTVAPNVGIYAGPAVLWADEVLGRAHGASTHEAWLRRVMFPRQLQNGLRLPRFDLPVRTDVAAVASVSRNCWVAQCPFPHCRGLSFEGIWKPAGGVPDFFYCCSCGNEAVEGQRIAIAFAVPTGAVEAVLEARPDAHTRNWNAGETIAMLRAENKAHNVPEERGKSEKPPKTKRGVG